MGGKRLQHQESPVKEKKIEKIKKQTYLVPNDALDTLFGLRNIS